MSEDAKYVLRLILTTGFSIVVSIALRVLSNMVIEWIKIHYPSVAKYL